MRLTRGNLTIKHDWLLCYSAISPNPAVFRLFILVLAFASSLALPQSGWAAQTSDCAVKFPNVRIISYQGDCRNGFIDGKADVLYERKKNSDGTLETVRHFGWFYEGELSGLHLLLSPSQPAPAVVLLVYYKKPGRWVYGLEWPLRTTLGDRSLGWLEVTGVADIEKPDLKDDKGLRLPANVQAGRLFDSLALHAKNNSIVSINAADIQNFLNAVSKTHPFASTNRSLLESTTNLSYLENPVRPDPDPVTKSNEIHTLDGCKFKVLATSAKDEQTKIAEEFENRVWDGACVDGWAYGPGTTTRIHEKLKFIVSYEWVQMGTAIGRFSMSHPNGWTGVPETSEGYIHPSIKDVYFIKTNLPGRQPEKGKVVHFSKLMADGSRVTFHTGSIGALDKCGKKSKGCLVRSEYLPDRYYSSITAASEKPMPCDNNCLDIWDQNAGPVLDEMDAFIAENKPKVDEIIQANTAALSRGTTLQQRLNNANQAKESAKRRGQEQAALIAKQEEAAARKSAESQRVLNEANQAKRPVRSPNLDALIKNIPVQQAKGKRGKKK